MVRTHWPWRSRTPSAGNRSVVSRRRIHLAFLIYGDDGISARRARSSPVRRNHDHDGPDTLTLTSRCTRVLPAGAGCQSPGGDLEALHHRPRHRPIHAGFQTFRQQRSADDRHARPCYPRTTQSRDAPRPRRTAIFCSRPAPEFTSCRFRDGNGRAAFPRHSLIAPLVIFGAIIAIAFVTQIVVEFISRRSQRECSARTSLRSRSFRYRKPRPKPLIECARPSSTRSARRPPRIPQDLRREPISVDRRAIRSPDLGGEGRIPSTDYPGFVDAINFNDHTHDGAHLNIAIPNLVLMTAFSNNPQYPVVTGTPTMSSCRSAPLTDRNAGRDRPHSGSRRSSRVVDRSEPVRRADKARPRPADRAELQQRRRRILQR